MSLTAPIQVVYWLKDGGSGKFPVPALDSLAAYPPLVNVVNLFAANLTIQGDGNIGVQIPDEISVVFSSGQASSLQAQGISVVLSILNDGSQSLGWSTLSDAQNAQLATSISEVVASTGIDGIDIDDEGLGGQPSNFYNTVVAIRDALPGIII